jgi:hypothetical protein
MVTIYKKLCSHAYQLLVKQHPHPQIVQWQLPVEASVLHRYGYTRGFGTGLGTGTGMGSHIRTRQKPIHVVPGQGFTV